MPKPSNGLYLRFGDLEGAAFGVVGIAGLLAAFAGYGIGSLGVLLGIGGLVRLVTRHNG